MRHFGDRAKKTKKFWVLLAAGITIIALLAFFALRPLLQNKKVTEKDTAKVTRGAILRTIEGSGVIEANDQYTVRALVTGEVLSDTFREGDTVTKDDLLYVIDSTQMDYTLGKAESGVRSARLSYEEALETTAHMQVTAPISGVIGTLSIKEGDEITAGKNVAEIADASSMVLTLPFLYTDSTNIAVGDAATVVIENAPTQPLSGTVKSVASGQSTSSLGALVSMVEIAFYNPGGVSADARATASVGSYACHEAGVCTYVAASVVTTKAGGTVTNLSVHAGDRVEKGQLLFSLESDAAARSLERSRLSYQDSLLNLENTYDQLEEYRITAPISGKVIQKSVKAGDKLENGSGGNASSMAIIADLSTLKFEIEVDELDISDIAVGQEVRVTADAAAGKVFTGHIDKVSIVGTTANGVTTYPVSVVLNGEENADLIPGMNVSATIVVDSKTDVLMIPVAAVTRGNMVLVQGERPNAVPGEGADALSPVARLEDKAATKTAKEEAPAGYRYVRIETGITDGTYIEVLSGLSEGDTVLVPKTVGSAESAMQFTPHAAPMMGGMGNMGNMSSGMMGGGRR